MARGLDTRSKIIAALDKEFSIWVRLSAADEYGIIRCYTCGETRHWKKRLDVEYGEGTADVVLAKSNQPVKFSSDELLSMLSEIRVKNKALLSDM